MKKVITTMVIGGMLAFVACSQVGELQKSEKSSANQPSAVR